MSRAIGTHGATPPLRSVVDPLPAGSYDVVVTSAHYEQAGYGNPTFRIEFTVTRGPHKGRTFSMSLVFDPADGAAAALVFSQLRALGLDGPFFAALPPEDAETEIARALVGRPTRITVAAK